MVTKLPKFPHGFTVGSAISGTDSFFDAVAKCLEQLMPGESLTIKSLRAECKDFVQNHFKEEKSWVMEALQSSYGEDCFDEYIARIMLTSEETEPARSNALNWKSPIRGRPEIEGRILCDIHNVKLHLIEKQTFEQAKFYPAGTMDIFANTGVNLSVKGANNCTVWRNKVWDRFGFRYTSNIDYSANDTIHILNPKTSEFIPVLRKLNIESPSSSSDDHPDILTYKLTSVVRSKKSEESKLRKLRTLVASGADINFVDANSKNTILHVAVRKQELKVISFLVEQNANVWVKNKHNRSVIDLAVQLHRTEILDILKKRVPTGKQSNSELDVQNNMMKKKIFSEMIAMKTNINKDSSKPKFKKGTGDSGFSGQCYEIYLLTLFKIRGECQTENFYLGCNVNNAGAFDDVVFKYWDKEGKDLLILLQAKHKDHAEQRTVNLQTFKQGGDLDLYKYFTSFQEVKQNFNKIRDDRIFGNQYEDGKCGFVIYTNACLDSSLSKLICPTRILSNTFRISNSGNAIKLRLQDILPYLAEQELEKHVIAVAKAFVEFMLSGNKESKMSDDLVRIYHVFWAQKLVQVNAVVEQGKSDQKARVKPGKQIRRVQFRYDFLNNCSTDTSMVLLRNVIFNEYAKKTMVVKQGKESSLEDATHRKTEFAQLLSERNSNVIKYEDMGECLVKTICNLTGIVITYDAESGHLKFAKREHLGSAAKKWVDELEDALRMFGIRKIEIHEFSFHVLEQIVIRKLQKEDFRVPETFGNVNPTFAKTAANICDQFVNILERCETTLENVCIIPGMSRMLLRDVCKWVGNVLVLNDESGFLQLTDKSLDGQAKDVFEQLTHKLTEKGISLETNFNFQIEYFPRLSLGNFHNIGKEIEEFVSNLTIYTDQPSLKGLQETIIEELADCYKLTCDEAWSSYLTANEKMTKWWERKGKVEYLRKDDGFFSNIDKKEIYYRLRRPVDSFTGRQKELNFIHRSLQMGQKSNKLTVLSQMATVSGLGGIGKSELARQYAFQHRDYHENIIWIEADNYLTMANSFRDLCRTRLDIPTQKADGSEIDIEYVVQQVYSFFSKRKSLFIFDNAENFNSQDDDKNGIAQFLPKSFSKNDNKPCFIVTSRNQAWPMENTLLLGTFSKYEAITFVKSFLRITDDSQDEDVEALTEMLQNFPLALQQAVAYIREMNDPNQISGRHYMISDYVRYYEQKIKEMLDFKFPEDSVDLYTRTTFGTWNITIETIGSLKYGNEAKEILNMMAFLQPNDIPVDLFKGVTGDNEKALRLSMNLLKQYSMISLDRGKANIHRVVQQVTRVNLKDKGNEKHVLGNTLLLLNDEVERKEVTSHGASAWEYSSKHDELVKEYKIIPAKIVKAFHIAVRYEDAVSFGAKALEQLNAVTDSECFLQHELASVLLQNGKYDEAFLHGKQCLEKRIKFLGPDNGETLLSKMLLGRLSYCKCQYDDALMYHREVFELSCKLWDANDEISIAAQCNIANCLFNQCHYDECFQMYAEILEKQTAVYGADNPHILTTQHSMANVLRSRGDCCGAILIYKMILDKRNNILGLVHPDTLRVIYDIAHALIKECKYDDAMQYFEQLLENQLQVLGPDNPDTLTTQTAIATILQHQKEYDLAFRHFNEIYKIRCNAFGSDNMDTLMVLRNIASVLSLQGKHSEAICYFIVILGNVVSRLGPFHIETLTTEFRIAEVLDNQCKYEDAVHCFRGVHEKLSTAYSSGLPFALTTLYNIASMLEKQGRFEEAVQVFMEVADKRIDVLGPIHPETLASQFAVARNLTKLEYYEIASQYQRMIFRKSIIAHGRHHEFTLNAQCEMAVILSKLGKNNEALVCFADLFEKQSSIDVNHPDAICTQFHMAAILQRLNETVHALRNFMAVYMKRYEVLGPQHPDTLETHLYVGHELVTLEKFEAALPVFQKVFQKYSEIYGSDNLQTLAVQRNIAIVLFRVGKYEESLCSYEVLFAAYMRILGPCNDTTLSTWEDLAHAQYTCGKYNDAVKSYIQMFNTCSKVLGPNHPRLVNAKNQIGQIMIRHKMGNIQMSL